jgi:hypothetical protein
MGFHMEGKQMELAHALAETAYIEADEAIARALQQTPVLRAALDTMAPELRAALGAMIQATRTAAAKRQMELQNGAVYQGRGENRRVIRAAP